MVHILEINRRGACVGLNFKGQFGLLHRSLVVGGRDVPIIQNKVMLLTFKCTIIIKSKLEGDDK